MTNIAQTFSPTTSLPVILDYDLLATFSTNDATTPTVASIFSVMSLANMKTYIEQFVWQSQPLRTSLFFDTQRTSFAARGAAVR
jgi:hypothetical protein